MGDDSSGEQGMANIHTLVQGAGYKDKTSKQKLPEETPYCILLGKNRGITASPTTQVQLHPPKAAQSLS